MPMPPSRYDRGVELIPTEDIAELLAGLNNWQSTDDNKAIIRELEFADFGRAMAFMTAVAIRADRIDHHPEWSNVYRKVTIRLSTHSAHGLDAPRLRARFVHGRGCYRAFRLRAGMSPVVKRDRRLASRHTRTTGFP